MKILIRPWQGTVLAVLATIGTVVTGIMGILAIFANSILQSMMGGFLQGTEEITAIEGGMMEFFQGFAIVFGIILLGLTVLDFFIAKGLFRGTRWTVIATIIFSGLSLLSALSDGSIGSIIISGALIYLAVTLLKHPYYNQGQ